MDVELGDLVELRLIGAENTESEARRLMWTYHTFHLHGYNFNVMSMGFPITDDEGKVPINRKIADIFENLGGGDVFKNCAQLHGSRGYS